jgi:hypothetical protein
MGDIVNLRTVRKRATRQRDEVRAAENRTIYGRSRTDKELAQACNAKSQQSLDAHRLDTGDAQ